jgi:hypothetical protein
MSLKSLVETFSCHTRLPVLIQDVVAQIVEMGVEDKITYVGVNLDINVLRGMCIKRTKRPGVYADPELVADIYYATNQEKDWQRLVVCKELIHLFDATEASTTAESDLNHLMENMALSPELQFQKDDGLKVTTDKLAILYAVCVLFPKDAREVLLEPYRQGIISAGNIARTAEIPEKYVRLAMHDEWEAIYETLIRVAG